MSAAEKETRYWTSFFLGQRQDLFNWAHKDRSTPDGRTTMNTTFEFKEKIRHGFARMGLVLACTAAVLACSEPQGYTPADAGIEDIGPHDSGPTDTGSDAEVDQPDAEVDQPDGGTHDTDPQDADDDPDATQEYSCQGRAPDHLQRAERCIWDWAEPDTSVDCSSWESFFGVPFPQGSTSAKFFQEPGEFLALEFDTENLSPSLLGQMNTEAAQYGAPANFQGGHMIWTISTCPGDFDREAIISNFGERCYMQGGSATRIRWSGHDPEASNHRCNLEPDKTYYLNVLFTDSPEGTPVDTLNWACTGGSEYCARLLEVL